MKFSQCPDLDFCPCCQKNVLDGDSWLCNDCKLHRDSCHTMDTKDTEITIDTDKLKKDHL